MGKYIGPKFKKERRAGTKLMLRGKSSESPNSPVVKRSYPPGVHGPKGHGRKTQFGQQLMEKQKARWVYNLREKQFIKYYQRALESTGDTGELLIKGLEMRLDNVVYRMGFATTRSQARQLVNHWHIQVNGKKVDRPSYPVAIGDEISIREKSQKLQLLLENMKAVEQEHLPTWVSVDTSKMAGKVVSEPIMQEMEPLFDVTSIVEFYSR